MTMASTPPLDAAPPELSAVEPPSHEEASKEASKEEAQSPKDAAAPEKKWNEQLAEYSLVATEFLHRAAVPAAVALAAVTLVSPSTTANWIIWPLYYTVLQSIGIAMGIGLGLGLATHVYDQLEHWKDRQRGLLSFQQDTNAPTQPPQPTKTASSSLGRTPSRNLHTPRSTYNINSTSFLQDEQTYESLMAAAGYTLDLVDEPNKVLRAQVLRSSSSFWGSNYSFTDANPPGTSTAAVRMQELWPTLPNQVNEQLGRWIEHILRDYVSVWFSSVDAGCHYIDAAAAKQQKEQSELSKESKEMKEGTVDPQKQQQPQQPPPARLMVFSAAGHRQSPFLEALYESMAILFGNLATRVEHVNLLEVILLKWTRILAHTFKVYRALRKSVKTKTLAHHHQQRHASGTSSTATPNGRSFRAKRRQQQQQRQQQQASDESNNTDEAHESSTATTTTAAAAASEGGRENQTFAAVSEIAMTKEFLFAGKLHRAITFGMDVPSLLFADASGRECGTGTDKPVETDDQVLEERLYGTQLLRECELDYNRVVGHRMVRALLPRADFGSPIVASLLTEIMGGSVLTSIMSCLCPEYLNGWIIAGLSPKSPTEEAPAGEEEANSAADEDDGLMRGWSHGAGPVAGPTGNIVDRADASGPESIEISTNKVNVPEEAPKVITQEDSSRKTLFQEEDETTPDTTKESTTASSKKSSNKPDLVVETKVNVKEEATVAFQLPDVPEGGDDIITQLAMALINLQQHVDFEEFRHARSNFHKVIVNWDDDGCRGAVLRLVLVIESALTNGRCTYRRKEAIVVEDLEKGNGEDVDDLDDSERPVEVTLPDYESATLSQILMEMTGDIEAFEERVATDNVLATGIDHEDEVAEMYKPTSTEQSTLRTLIAAWLHTGQIYRTVTVLVQAHATILGPYYNSNAFLRSQGNAAAFVRQLKALDGVDVLVDTMTVLASPRLDETNIDELDALARRSSNRPGLAADRAQEEAAPAMPSFPTQYMAGASSVPRHLDFHRNEAFASSLRSERERRKQSWESMVYDETEGLPIICRSKGVTEKDIALHKELHYIARIFYTGTNLVGIRDAARRKNSQGTDSASNSDATDPEAIQTALLTVETACPRRRIEVPDDDSSFLLRAQPRALNAVGVHRDQRNHDLSFRSFAATYEEPSVAAGTDHYNGGRFLRRCLIKYYPSDRTASVAVQPERRKVDRRKKRGSVPDTITVDKSSRSAPFISEEFQRERHLCQKWEPKGTTRTQSMLASSVMEQTDFTSMPRPGKAIDYVYRMAFFERPMVDLGGKHFTVHDSSSLGTHRADASSLELSDASLSTSILMMDTSGDPEKAQQITEMGQDGYPIIWMKYSRKQDDAPIEVKPYRVSFVRAALLVTTARQEAQLQCLVKCVRAGSAKSATKALTDGTLKPALKLMEYAGSRSREKQSLLLRDLKLGINHIDREQLRRNTLFNPRYPTVVTELSAIFEDAVQASDLHGVDLMGATGNTTLYKIRCVATLDYEADEDTDGSGCYRFAEDGSIAESFREEWVVYRSFKDIQALHKHLKSQVSATESSGTAGSRLVGAATAAFAAGGSVQGRHRQRQVLIPSLSHATKAVTLGATRKSVLKRKDYLHEYIGYILSPGHLLSRCIEILLFLGAFYPLPTDVKSVDPLGRREMRWTVVRKRVEHQEINASEESAPNVPPTDSTTRAVSIGSLRSSDGKDEDAAEDDEERESSQKLRKIDMIPAIRNKIDKVPLSQVRNRIFELLRYQFGFENASFIRNRMLAALKTASFAVTSAGEFQRTLYKIHTDHITATALAGWIDFGLGLLWPGGVFFTSAPRPTQEELDTKANKAKEVLHSCFPEQVRAILGQELTRDGLDIFHEMLQNRVVVRSMAYMLFDLLWLEVFPEIGDVLVCGAALDIDS